jgi:YggT family protein
MMGLILAQAVNIFGQVLVLLIIGEVILSYVLDPYHPLRRFVGQLVEPLLAPIRRVMPSVGMFDFSPMVLIILVQLITNLLSNFLIRLR